MERAARYPKSRCKALLYIHTRILRIEDKPACEIAMFQRAVPFLFFGQCKADHRFLRYYVLEEYVFSFKSAQRLFCRGLADSKSVGLARTNIDSVEVQRAFISQHHHNRRNDPVQLAGADQIRVHIVRNFIFAAIG